MRKLTRPWVRKAEADYRAANQLARSRPPLHDIVCFHCQQCAEKYLKALLVEAGLTVPKIHDLVKLRDRLLALHVSLADLDRPLIILNDYAVEVRYPSRFPTKRDARSALRWAGRVRLICRRLLGLREKKGKSP